MPLMREYIYLNVGLIAHSSSLRLNARFAVEHHDLYQWR